MSENLELDEPDVLDVTYDPVAGATSVSKLKKMGTCGRQFKFRYVEKVEEEPAGALAFGKAVHETVEAIHKNKLFGAMDWYPVWAENWARHQQEVDWSAEGFKKTRYKTYNEMGPNFFSKYVQSAKLAVVIGSEIRFPTDDESRQFYIGKHPIMGYIDQVRRLPDGRLLVVDFKTGKNPPDDDILRTDPQFTFYWWVVKQIYGEDPLLCWWHVKTNKPYFTKRTLDDLVPVIEMLDECKQKAELAMYGRNFGYHCGWCQYRHSCLKQDDLVDATEIPVL